MFPGLQSTLNTGGDRTGRAFPVLKEPAAALPNSGVVRPTSLYLRSVHGQARSHLGRRGATARLCVAGTAGGQRSLLLTAPARGIQGALNG